MELRVELIRTQICVNAAEGVEFIRIGLKTNRAIIISDSYLKGLSAADVYLKETNRQMQEDPIDVVFIKPGYAIAALKSSVLSLNNLARSPKVLALIEKETEI